MPKEGFRKVSTTILRNVNSDHDGWSGALEGHKNLTNHQIAVVCSGVLSTGIFGIEIFPDTENVTNSVDVGKVIDLRGKDSSYVTFSGILRGLRLRMDERADAGLTMSIIVSSYARHRPRWPQHDGRLVDYDYVSSTLFREKNSDLGEISRNVENHRNLVFHQVTLHADDDLSAGEYRVRFMPDDDQPLETSVDTGKTLVFSDSDSAFVQFGAILRGIHLEPITVADSGSKITGVLSSSVERFDEITYDYIGTHPTLGSHITDFNNPHQTSWDNLLNKPDHVLSWKGDWKPIHYDALSLVFDRPFLMAAKTDTCDRAAPQLVNGLLNPFDISLLQAQFQNLDNVEFQNGDPVEFAVEEWDESSDASVVFSGHKYTFTTAGQISLVKVWIPEIGAAITYRLAIIIDPDGTDPRYEIYDIASPVAGAWNDVSIPNLMAQVGDVVLIYLTAIATASETTSFALLTFEGANCSTYPAVGEWNHQANTLLRVSKYSSSTPFKVELGAVVDMEVELATGTVVMEIDVDIAALLATLTADTLIRFADDATPGNYVEYRIMDDPVDNSSWVGIVGTVVGVGGAGPTPGAVTSIMVTVPTVASVKYVFSADNWLGNQPAYVTVEGYLAYDGVEQVISSDNAYGVEIDFQKALWSSDWDIVHMPAGL